jgi:hypothetical protein
VNLTTLLPLLLLLLLLPILLLPQASLADQYSSEEAELQTQASDVASLAAELAAVESASAELAAAAEVARSALQEQQAALQQEVRRWHINISTYRYVCHSCRPRKVVVQVCNCMSWSPCMLRCRGDGFTRPSTSLLAPQTQFEGAQTFCPYLEQNGVLALLAELAAADPASAEPAAAESASAGLAAAAEAARSALQQQQAALQQEVRPSTAFAVHQLVLL